MDSSHWPLILIEGVLVFGGALAFGWWQLRSVRRDRERMQADRVAQAERERQRTGEAAPHERRGEAHSPDSGGGPG